MKAGGGGFSTRAIAWLAGGAAVSFALAFVLSAFGQDLGEPQSSGNDAFSRSALGHQALFRLLRERGVTVDVQRVDLPFQAGEAAPLLVLDPPPTAEWLDIDRRYDRRQPGDGALVLGLPKRRGLADATRPGWVSRTELTDHGAFSLELDTFLAFYNLGAMPLKRTTAPGPLECEAADGTVFRVELDPVQSIAATANFEPLVRCGDRVLVARTTEVSIQPPIVLVADPDLYATFSIGKADHAALMEHVVVEQLAADRLIVDETIHGFDRAPSILAEMFRFPLVLALSHGLIVLGLAIWAGMRRFGSPRRTQQAGIDGRAVLVDNAAQLLALGHHSPETARSYFRHAVRTVARSALPAGGEITLERLQEVSRRRGTDVDLVTWEREIETLAEGDRKETRKAVLWARRIHRWRQEMLHGRGTYR